MNVFQWLADKLQLRSNASKTGGGSSSGRLVVHTRYSESLSDPEQTMRLDAVYRCVGILSGTIASLTLMAQRKRGEVFEYDEGDMLNYLFTRQANPRQTFYALMENAVINILLRGNAYILPLRNEAGEYEAFYLLQSEAVSYDVQSNKYTVYDWVTKQSRVYEAWELIHLKNKSLDGGYLGVSTIHYAGRTLAVSANADEQTLEGFKGGNKLKGFLSGGDPVKGFGSTQDKYVDEVAERLAEEIDSGKPVMRLPGALQFTPLSLTPADAQLLENRKFSAYSICRFFGVHPDMVFVEGGSSNYKASENSQITFLNQTLRPLLSQIQAEFSAKLIMGSPRVQMRRRIVFNLMDLYSSDLKSRSEYYKTSVEAGILTPNEIRQMENRQPIDGGDVTFISCNVAPINSSKISGEAQTKDAHSPTP